MAFLSEILEEKRKSSNIGWATKKYIPSKTQASLKLCNPLLYQFYVLNDISDYVEEISKSSGISTVQLYILIEKILREIGYARSTTTVRSVGFIVFKIMKRILNKMYLAESNLLRIRNEMGNNPVIFLPTHRSYADFILMAFLCYEYDIEIPAVVAGMDFHSMILVADLLRKCGALFMRRSFSNDKIYATVFKRYVKMVLKKSPAPFEFFIEGTRSRSGKSLMPKLGLLKIAVELYEQGEVSDITLVPISISYDRVMEDTLMAYEVLGKPKPKESTKGLFKGIRTMDDKLYGNIYINMNESISLKEYFRKDEDKSLLDLALTVVRRQQNNSIITCFNILSMIISCRLNEDACCTVWQLSHLVNEVRFMKRLLESLDAAVGFKDGEEENEIIRVISIHDKLLQIDDIRQHVTLNFVQKAVSSAGQNDMVPDQVLLAIMLQYYSNPCLHFLVNPVMILVLVMTLGLSSLDALYSFYRSLRRIFSEEFVFHQSDDETDFRRALKHLQNEGLMDVTIRENNATFEFDEKVAKLYFNLLYPFLLGCVNTCEFFKENLDVAFEEKMLVNKLRNDVMQRYHRFRGPGLAHVYSLSSCFILNTLRSLSSSNVLKCTRTNTCVYTCNNEISLSSVIQFLRAIISNYVEPPADGLKVPSLCKL